MKCIEVTYPKVVLPYVFKFTLQILQILKLDLLNLGLIYGII